MQSLPREVLMCDEAVERLRKEEEEQRVAKKVNQGFQRLTMFNLSFSTQKTKKVNPVVNHLIKMRMIQNILYVIIYCVWSG